MEETRNYFHPMGIYSQFAPFLLTVIHPFKIILTNDILTNSESI